MNLNSTVKKQRDSTINYPLSPIRCFAGKFSPIIVDGGKLIVDSFLAFLVLAVCVVSAWAQTGYENLPISKVEIVLENSAPNQFVAQQFEQAVREVVGDRFSAVKNREALQKLYDLGRNGTGDAGRVEAARIEVVENAAGSPRSVKLRFVVRRTTLVERVAINVDDRNGKGDKVTEAELLLRVNLLASNTVFNQRAVQQSADQIQTYLRERGYYKAAVDSNFLPPATREVRSNVTFNVKLNDQATVDKFDLNIKGFDNAEFVKSLKLQSGENFSQAKLNQDIARIRRELVKQDFLAANLDDPKITLDADANKVSIRLTGNVNAKVALRVVDENNQEIKFSARTQRDVFALKRDGQLDRSAIEDGRRRLRTRLQETGYFFAAVNATCGVEPFTAAEAAVFPNNTETACDFLDGLNLENRQINILYTADRSRRFKLTEVRLEGTNRVTIDDFKPALRTQTANALAIIPRLGYGRGFTSNEILQDDARTIKSLLRELGYRNADVRVRQGISPTGDDLIITFVVRENALARIAAVEVTGNKAFSTNELNQQIKTDELVNSPYSRVRTRNGNNRILRLYSENGYIDARSTFSFVDLPSTTPGEERVKIIYNIEREGAKTFVNRILTVGNQDTKNYAILETVPLKPGDVLRADRITEAERRLYSSDAFRQITTTTEPAGTNADGTAKRDVIFDLQEQPTRILTYGGGFSTDDGPNGFVGLQQVNFLGKLFQLNGRIRASRLQQLVQVDFTDPRFVHDPRAASPSSFAPLTLSAQYSRDTGVTRFFRTTLDKGTLGIVQRLDANGNPLDEFGAKTNSPSINRLTLNAETSRTLNPKTRSLLFVRYRFEDVRILNVRSLIVAPILLPDRSVRISGVGATFGFDTRENCNSKRSLLEQIRTGEPGNPCQYNATDATRGQFLTVDYQLSARFLGGNTSFNKLQATYQRYQQFNTKYGKLVLAARGIFGLASLFQTVDRDGNGVIDETERTLPISERFFAGGSTDLRGFDFEEAGPRRAIIPQGQFRLANGTFAGTNNGYLNPFTVPVGGNALAVTNLEARIPLANYFQIVPFYDGGNVFRRVSDVFTRRNAATNSVDDFNLRSIWTNTLGFGFRLKTPIGGTAAVDYGYLLNPPTFLIPQVDGTTTNYRYKQSHIHFRFTQAF